MKNLLFLCIALVGVHRVSHAQNTVKAWQHDMIAMEGDTAAQSSYGGIYDLSSDRMIVTGAYDKDAVLSCIDSNGVVIWRKIFGGTAIDNDGVNSVCIANGLIYATGYLSNEVTRDDIFVKCFDLNGNEIYSYQRDGMANYNDHGVSITVNSSGYAFIGGYIVDSATVTSGYLACISPTGSLTWEVTTDGTAIGNSNYNSLLIKNNQLIAAGTVFNQVTGSDAHVESRNFSGALNWVYQYDFNNTSGGYAIVKEYNNDLILAGSSNGPLVQRMTMSGNLTWSVNPGVSVYGVAFQLNGNIIVSGAVSLSGNSEIRLVSLSPAGSQNWMYTHIPTPYNGQDQPSAIKIDAMDQIYVSGQIAMSSINRDQLLMKFSPAGALLWTRRRNGTSTGFNLEFGLGLRLFPGRIMMAGILVNTGSNDDGSLSAHDYAGSSIFLHRYTGGYGVTQDIKLAFRPNQNVVTGGSGTYNSVLFEELNSGGQLIHRDTVMCPGGSSPWLQAMTVDTAGNCIAVINFTNAQSTYSIYVIKLDAQLDTVWSLVYNSPANGHAYAYDVVTDDSCNIYIAVSAMINTSGDGGVLKVDPNGNLIASRFFNGTANSGDETRELVVSASGYLYALVRVNNSGTGNDGLLVRLTPMLDTIWTQSISGPTANGNDQMLGLAEAASDSIVVFGGFYFTGANTDMFLNKYAPDGSLAWNYLLSGSAYPEYDRPYSCVTHLNDVYFTGEWDQGSTSDIIVGKIDASGTVEWLNSYNGSPGADDEGNSIAFDSYSQAVWVTGTSQQEIITLEYSLSGIPQDTIIEVNVVNSDVGVINSSPFNSGSLYVGASRQNEMNRLIKYCLDGSSSTSVSMSICANDTVQLVAPSGSGYQWTPASQISNATIQSPYVYPATTTTYSASVTSAAGCVVPSYFTVTVAPPVSLSLSVSSAVVCSGDSLQIHASGLQNYLWQPALYISDSTSSDPWLYGTDTISYTVMGPDIFGCTSDTGTVLIYTPLVTASLQLTLPDTVCNTNGSWNLGGGMPVGGVYSGNGVSAGIFYPNLADTGINIITYSYTDVTSGCVAVVTDSVFMEICTALEENYAAISCYPNPGDESITISSTSNSDFTLKLFDAQGNLVYEAICSGGSHTIQTAELTEGIYFIQVSSSDLLMCRPITILHQ